MMKAFFFALGLISYGTSGLFAQTPRAVAGVYAGTETDTLTVTGRGGAAFVETIARADLALNATERGALLTLEARDATSGRATTRTLVRAGHRIVGASGPIMGFDAASGVSIAENRITSAAGLVLPGEIHATLRGRVSGVFNGAGFQIEVVSRIVLAASSTAIAPGAGAGVPDAAPSRRLVGPTGSVGRVTADITLLGAAPLNAAQPTRPNADAGGGGVGVTEHALPVAAAAAIGDDAASGLAPGTAAAAPAGLAFTTFAGRFATGSADGAGTVAGFFHPSSVAVDAQGNAYVADTNNHTVRKISAAGVVSTLAGAAGQIGSADGVGAAARFHFPSGVTVDTAGNVYVADTTNHTLRKITPAGAVTTLAGEPGVAGGADGAGAAGRFDNPCGLAVDGAGNIYVADLFNSTIRRVSPAGVVTTVAGLAGAPASVDGTGSAARFNYPTDVAVDAAGNLYVADTVNYTVRKIAPGGVVTTLAGAAGAGGGADGAGVEARFDYPTGVAVDGGGTLYVTDTAGHTVRRVTAAGAVTTLAGNYGVPGSADGAGAAARFNYPLDVALDAAGNLHVADYENHAIRKIAAGALVTTLAGPTNSAGSLDGRGVAARFNFPQGMALDGAGNLYVADAKNHTVRKLTPAGEVVTLAGLGGAAGASDGTGAAARFNQPKAVAVDAVGNVYVADTDNHVIRRITPAGVVTTFAGQAGSPGAANGTGGAARFSFPQGIAIDGTGDICVSDTNNQTIRRITPGGAATTIAGSAALPGGSADGLGGAARFNHPAGLVADAGGNLYVADALNHTIRKITPAGMVSTLAGLAGAMGSVDGVGGAARFNKPYALALDASGDLYAVDMDGHTIRHVTAAGAVVTLAGQAWVQGSADGANAGARFAEPTGIAVDAAGVVYVADSANNTIRRGTALAKASGGAYEFAANISHPNGNVYDQVLLSGGAATITADAGQVTRMSYIDLSDDIVQVEFSGPGALTLRLENATGPALPVNYNQAVSYMRGHATLIVAGATASTHVSVFTVGTVTAVNPALFKAGVSYDGVADIALLSISSVDGRFGGVRLANTEFSSNRGTIGIAASGVGFAGPINVHNVSASDQAEPALLTGTIDTGQVGVTGGDMRQLNNRAVKIEGATTIRMLAGATSHNAPQPAQTNQGRYERNGLDVTSQVVQGP